MGRKNEPSGAQEVKKKNKKKNGLEPELGSRHPCRVSSGGSARSEGESSRGVSGSTCLHVLVCPQ